MSSIPRRDGLDNKPTSETLYLCVACRNDGITVMLATNPPGKRRHVIDSACRDCAKAKANRFRGGTAINYSNRSGLNIVVWHSGKLFARRVTKRKPAGQL